MQLKKAVLITGTVAGIGLAGIGGLGIASAASSNTDNTEPTGIIERLAAKFNLNKDEVAAVFKEDRAAHEAEHQQKLEARLDQAVTDGKLTEDQKSKILSKLEELKASRESNMETFKNMTADERRATMEQKRTDLEQWAKDNNIPTDLMPFGFGGPGRGGHMWMHKGPGGPEEDNSQ